MGASSNYRGRASSRTSVRGACTARTELAELVKTAYLVADKPELKVVVGKLASTASAKLMSPPALRSVK
jgi:hypothetical protein